MNYNQRNPIFSFRLSDYRKSKLDKLALLDKTSANEFARKIIDKYLANELIEKTEDLDKEMIKLRIEKLKNEIEYQKLKINYMKNFDKPMSASATRIIKTANYNHRQIPPLKLCRHMMKKIIAYNVLSAVHYSIGKIVMNLCNKNTNLNCT